VAELTREEMVRPDEQQYRITGRLHWLNDLGFDAGQVQHHLPRAAPRDTSALLPWLCILPGIRASKISGAIQSSCGDRGWEWPGVSGRWLLGSTTSRCLSYHCATLMVMAVRKKRSISMPPDLDAEIASAAAQAGMSYSAWLAETARKEFTIRAGLAAVSQFEQDHGAFTPEELAEAEQWAASAVERASRTGSSLRRRTA
jgi:hypothetical protein